MLEPTLLLFPALRVVSLQKFEMQIKRTPLRSTFSLRQLSALHTCIMSIYQAIIQNLYPTYISSSS